MIAAITLVMQPSLVPEFFEMEAPFSSPSLLFPQPLDRPLFDLYEERLSWGKSLID